ncbi:MAG: hypothetical protein U0797_02855 [Gemmataceae bacterium]
MTLPRLLVTVLVVAGLTGCRSRPRAPALDNSPVYVNRQEGFRFLVPEGWVQQSKAEIPPGYRLDDSERTVVLYRAFKPTPASMDVSCRDIPEDVDIGAFLAKRKRSGVGWSRAAPPESVEYGGRKGTRYFLKGSPGGLPTRCEAVVFRRGGRVYFFGGFYPAGETIRRAQIRQFLEDLTWTSD